MSIQSKSILLVVILFLGMVTIFILFPIRIFPAEVITSQYVSQGDISLGDWLGFTEAADRFQFKMIFKGYLLLFIITLGLPFLIGYSYWIKKNNTK